MGDTRQRTIAGCMTGTSLDGLDVALTQVRGTGLDMTAHFIGMVSLPLGDLADQLRHFAEGHAAPPLDFVHAGRQLGELHADAVALLCDEFLPKDATLDFVVAHGQTIWHAPGERAKAGKQKSRKAENETQAEGDLRRQHCNAGLSWQLFDPWPIMRRLKVPVCYDLRQADLIAGGQGAPITPIADWVMYRSSEQSRMVINLGGICNATYLPATRDDPSKLKDVFAGDILPCNILIDGLVQEFFPGKQFDEGGELAATGRRDCEISFLVGDHPKTDDGLFQGSLGREDFPRSWIQRIANEASKTMSPNDILAAACGLVAGYLEYMNACEFSDSAVLAGGGTKNHFLVKCIRESLSIPTSDIHLSDDLGIPCEAREAMGFAVLGALSQDGVPITLPRVTGAIEPGVAGAWAGVS